MGQGLVSRTLCVQRNVKSGDPPPHTAVLGATQGPKLCVWITAWGLRTESGLLSSVGDGCVSAVWRVSPTCCAMRCCKDRPVVRPNILHNVVARWVGLCRKWDETKVGGCKNVDTTQQAQRRGAVQPQEGPSTRRWSSCELIMRLALLHDARMTTSFVDHDWMSVQLACCHPSLRLTPSLLNCFALKNLHQPAIGSRGSPTPCQGSYAVLWVNASSVSV